jgi:hypothetical protein
MGWYYEVKCEFFFGNLNQMVIMKILKVKIEPYFQKFFLNEFFFICQIFCAQWVCNWNI